MEKREVPTIDVKGMYVDMAGSRIYEMLWGDCIHPGGVEDARALAEKAGITNGASAVWPGCDIWPTAPAENVRALVEATGRWWAFEQIAVHTPSETFGG